MTAKQPWPCILALSCFLVTPVLSGAVFYVNNSGSPKCNDSSGNGAKSSPWCTINYGISHINGGDRLYVRAGTYNEDVYVSGPAGTAAKPTIIQSYPRLGAIIMGDGVDSGRVKIANTSYIVFDGFRVTNFNQGIFVESSSQITVQYCAVYNIGQEGIHVHYGSSNVTINRCAVHDTGVWQYNGEGIYIGTGDSSPVDQTGNVTVRNSIVYNTTDEGIEVKIGTHDVTVDGCTVYNNNTAGNGYGGAAIEVNQSVGSVQHWDSNPNHIVRNNIVHNNGTGTGGALVNSGIRAGTGGSYYNNVVYGINSQGYGIYSDNQSGDSYTRKIYHNTVDVTSSRAFVNSGATADVRNNIGPTGANNLATNAAYFVNQAMADYHLAAGSAPIDSGVDLTSIVPTDIEGTSRIINAPPDLGAYEYVAGSGPGLR